MATFTKKAIIESFLKLLVDRPLSQITVKDIVEDCGINRNTFYYHFEDMPALVEEVLRDDTEKLIAESNPVNSLEDCLSVAIDMAIKRKKAVLHICRSSNRESYENYLNNLLRYAVTKYIETVSAGIPISETDKNIIINFYKCELFGFIMDWINAGMSYDIRETVRRTCELFEGVTLTAFLKSAGCS